MEKRKSDKANLEKSRFLFKGIGYTLIAGLVFAAFSFKTYNKVAYDFTLDVEENLEELPPLVPPPPPMQAPPPPPPAAPQEPEIEIVEDDVETPEEDLDEEEDEDLEVEETEIVDEEPEEIVEDIPLTWVKNMPYYKECADKASAAEKDKCSRQLMISRIRQNFVMPDIARDMGYEGTVWVKFVINKQGRVSNVSVARGVNKVLDNAAMKAVQKLPPMFPGKQLDKPASILYTVPVKITME